MRAAAALLVAAGLAAGPAAGCEPVLASDGVQRIASERFRIALATHPSPIPVGQPFRVELAVCAGDGTAIQSVAVDADMPMHGHGMNYHPSVTATGPGRWLADGLLFHMPGHWRFRIAVTAVGTVDRAVLDRQVE